MNMKRFTIFGLFAVLCAVGCDRSQDIPPGASYKDPVGVNQANAAKAGQAGPTAEQAAASQKIGDDARNFGEQMNQKYGGR
jgi:hypothetical protein